MFVLFPLGAWGILLLYSLPLSLGGSS